jgi:hypothetical protein
MNYESVGSVSELRSLDDSNFLNMRCCKLNDEAWFLIDRLCTDADDGRSRVMTASGRGRWVIMTPATMGIVAAAKQES